MESNQKQLIPGVTMAAIAACIAVFIGLGSTQSDLWRDLAKWGLLSPDSIYEGAWWGLVTSAFVHREIWHIAFNLYWLWFLGGAMERSIGSLRYAAFILLAAFVSSSLQMSISGAGIGMSGVGYAIFGFGWLARDKYPELKRIVTPQVINLFLIWMFICFPLTWLHILTIGNAAHVSGLLFGISIAAAFAVRLKPILSVAAVILLIGASVAVMFYSPWSMDWTSHRALAAHRAHRYAEAVRMYRKTLDLGADPKWVWHNLAEILGVLGPREAYSDAILRLRELDAGSAKEVEADHGPPEGKQIPVPSPK